MEATYSGSTVVGLSLGIVTAYLLGLGTASAVAVIMWLCVKKRSGTASFRCHVLVLLLCNVNEATYNPDNPLPLHYTPRQQHQ